MPFASFVRRVPPLVSVMTLCLGGLAAALTQTVVIPLQPQFPQLLNATPGNAAWVVTVTLVTGAVSMVISGRLADLYGKHLVLFGCSSLLLVSSAICAVSNSLIPMLIGRGVQGLAMGFIPVAISMIRQITPPRMAATAIAAVSATLGVGGAIGLPVSAWIVQSGDWHHVFWMSAAVALVVMVLMVFTVPRVHDAGENRRLDAVGAVGLAAGLVLVLVGVSKATSWGWTDSRTLGAVGLGVLILLLWGKFELNQDEPVVDLRTGARLPVLMTNLAGVMIGFGMMANAIVMPQLLQAPDATGYGLGQTILEAGLWMAPQGLVMMLMAPVSGGLTRRFGAKFTLMIGAAVLALSYLLAPLLMGSAPTLLIATCLAGAGVGIGYAAMPTLILDAVPAHEAAASVGLNSLGRAVGTSTSAAVMGTILSSSSVDFRGVALPTEQGFVTCFITGGVALLVGLVLASFIPSQRPARTSETELVGAVAAD